MSIGYTFPFVRSSGSIGYLQSTSDIISATKQNLKSVIMTNNGERPMRYGFGCNLIEFLFEPEQLIKTKVGDRIMSQVEKWLPYVLIDQLNILTDSDDPANIPSNSLKIFLKFSVKGRQQGGELSLLVSP